MATMESTDLGRMRGAQDFVDEYDEKLERLEDLKRDFDKAVSAVELGSAISGAYGRVDIFRDRPRLDVRDMKAHLLRSAWSAAYSACKMEIIATAEDKSRFETDMADPPPFTVENLTLSFGPYLANPREHILRGLAEAFISLDDAYKSHSKVKVGVKGLPKRVIIKNAASEWGRAWGWDRVADMLNALKVFDGDGLVPQDILHDIQYKRLLKYRGLEFRWHKNGNVHIHFSEHACLQINRGLAEYYGDVLPDVEPDKTAKPKTGQTAVSKDLQYYPSPAAVVDQILSDISLHGVDKILEPSCGCGRILDGLSRAIISYRKNLYVRPGDKRPPAPRIAAVEYDSSRAKMAQAKGYAVRCGNFLEVHTDPSYDLIAMNPPFYGKHYLKHIEHALKFLKPGGTLVSILPATAHYDHKQLPEGYSWRDLPVGSFAESGVRVPTGYATWRF